MFKRFSKLLLISCLVLGACSNNGGVTEPSGQGAPVTNIDTDFLISIASSQQSIRNYVSNKTLIAYSPSHGLQIEYYSPSGDLFLWYPGNTRIVEGHWKAQSDNEICYLYPSSSRNPVTDQMGGTWECTYAAAAFIFDYERLPGNPFNLEPGPVDFVLTRRPFQTASTVAGRLGIDSSFPGSLKTARN